MSIKKITLILDFHDFITDILTDIEDNKDSIDSLYKLIKFYYSERVDINSDFFDPIAFIDNNNDTISISSDNSNNSNIQMIESSKQYNDTISISSDNSNDSNIQMIESHEHLYDNKKYKRKLELFLKKCQYY